MGKIVTFFIYNTKNNGGNRSVFEQATTLIKKGHTVEIVTVLDNGMVWQPYGIKPKRIHQQFLKRYDTLVVTFWPTAILSLLLFAKEKYYYIQGYEGAFSKNLILNVFANLSYFLPLKKVTTSTYLAKKIRTLTWKKEHIKVILGNSLDPTVFYSRRRKRSDGKVRVISVVSRYTYPKGIDILTDIITTLKRNGEQLEFTLVSYERRPYAKVFDTFYSNLSQTELAKVYRKSDILLATGRNEGFFLPGLEAMACGALFVTTDSGGIHEYAKHMHNAIILSDSKKLFEQDFFLKLFANRTLYLRLINNGYKTVAGLAAKTTTQNIEEAYGIANKHV